MADDRHLANVIGAFALQVVTQVEAAVQRATDLSMVEATALSALANLGAGSSSVEELRQVVDLSQSATVRLVDRLVSRGLVKRRGSVEDRRVTSVQLSAAGRKTVGKLRRIRLDALEGWVSGLSSEQRAALAPLVDHLVTIGIEAAPTGGSTADYICRWCEPNACGHPERCPVTAALHRAPLT